MPPFEVHLYTEGYLRTSSELFDLSDFGGALSGGARDASGSGVGSAAAADPHSGSGDGRGKATARERLLKQQAKEASRERLRMVHLTNYCMQRTSANLSKYEDGNTLSFAQLEAYLEQRARTAGGGMGASAALDGGRVSVLLFTVTLYANLAHNLTRSP